MSLEVIKEVATNLIPPDAVPRDGLTKWRLWSAGILLLTASGLVIHVLLACGLLPFYPGFAKAGEAEAVKVEMTRNMADMESRVLHKTEQLAEAVRTQRINTIRKDLFDLRQKQCSAPSGAVRTMLAEQISQLNAEHEALSGRKYDLLSCSDY